MQINFKARVAQSGYRINHGFLVPREPVSGFMEVDIEAHSALFRKFSRINTSEGIVEFANKYGPLGFNSGYVPNTFSNRLMSEWGGRVIGSDRDKEPVKRWFEEAKDMAWFLRIYDARREGLLLEELDEWVFTEDSNAFAMNLNLHFAASVFLMYREGRWVAHAIDLLGILWVQFTQMLSGERNFNQCQNQECRNWFEVGGRDAFVGMKRSDAKFCSDFCRNHVNNRRRQRPTTRAGRQAATRKTQG